MNVNTEIPWNSFDWKLFQNLCISLAEEVFPGTLFDEYLKQGAPQEGIDLLSLKKESGKFVTIQCKRVKNFDEPALKKIIETFLAGEFAERSDRFIIAVSAETHHKDIQLPIYDWKNKVYEERKIELEVWGREDLEKHLQKHWSLTEYFFGKAIADSYCILQVFNPDFPLLSPIRNYISRKITTVVKQDDQHRFWYRENLLDLQEIFLSHRTAPQHICIVGGPYYGKSIYLRQVAYQLSKEDNPFYPLFIEVKQFMVQPIEQLLDSRYGAWQSIPSRQLILFIDGLDEARTDQFVDMVHSIQTFTSKYPVFHVVLSCRKLFYDQYNIPDLLPKFSFYELYRLEEGKVEDYLKEALGRKYEFFINAINTAQLGTALYQPFYLENIVSQYKENRRLPASKIAVVEYFIKNAYDRSKGRQLSGGRILGQQLKLFQQTIKRFALALQIAGLNAMNDEMIQELFTSQEQELLQHNSMVSASDGWWSFTNAMFQEHFCALALSGHSIQQIVSVSSVGLNIKKIKTKWLQTLASLVSLLNEEDQLFNELLDYFRSDNIELLFQVEPTKFQKDFRFRLLKDYIDKVNKQQVRSTVVTESRVGEFVDGISEALEYLLSILESNEASDTVKITCCDVLESVSIESKYHDRLRAIVIRQIGQTQNDYYASNLVGIIVSANAGTKVLIDLLVAATKFEKVHEYRQSIYKLILQTDLVDTYYQFAIDGITHLITYNKGMTHAGSEYRLEELLLETNSYINIRLLFQAIASKEWIETFHHYRSRNENFLCKLLEKCASLVQTMPWVIFPVCDFMIKMPRYELEGALDYLDKLFSDPQAEMLAVHLFCLDRSRKFDWQTGVIVTVASFDYLLHEFEERGADRNELGNFMYGLHFRHDGEYEKFWQSLDGLLQGQLSRDSTNNNNDSKEYQNTEKIKRDNDRILIESKENMRKGVEAFFEAHGKKSIDIDELFIDGSSQLRRYQFESNFLFRHMIDCKQKANGNIRLSACLNGLRETDKDDWFQYRRAHFLLHSYSEDEYWPFYKQLLHEQFIKGLNDFNFVNVYLDMKGVTKYNPYAAQIGELFVEFGFEAPLEKLPHLLWLDIDGIRSFKSDDWNTTRPSNQQSQSIAQLVIQSAGNENLDLVCDEVLKHIEIGIQAKDVLGSHFAICARFNVKEAAGEMLCHIKRGTFEPYRTVDLVKAYLGVDGDGQEVLSYFESLTDFESYTFLNLIEVLIVPFPQAVHVVIKKAFKSETIQYENKIGLARRLAQLADINGFLFLVDEVVRLEKAPYTIQGTIDVHFINTAEALKAIDRIVFMVIDPKYDDQTMFHESARSIIMEWLNGLASKSEKDLMLVLEFLQNKITELEPTYGEKAKFFNFYIERMLENFRSTDNEKIQPAEIAEILNSFHR